MNRTPIQIQYVLSHEGLKAALLEIFVEQGIIKPATKEERQRPPANRTTAAAYLGISLPTLDILFKTGQIPRFNIGRQVRVKWEDLEAYVNKKSGIDSS
jgi:excisionase family DNA binding protein